MVTLPARHPTTQCVATAKTTGEQCKRRPIPGGTVCRKHGGGNPNVQAAAKQRLLQAKIQGKLREEGWEPVHDPITWLKDRAGEADAFLALARQNLNELSTWENVTDLGASEVRAIVKVYTEALDRVTQLGAKMVQLGFEEKYTAARMLQAQATFDGLLALVNDARNRPDIPAEQIVAEAVGGKDT